jgi:hypothetical protein
MVALRLFPASQCTRTAPPAASELLMKTTVQVSSEPTSAPGSSATMQVCEAAFVIALCTRIRHVCDAVLSSVEARRVHTLPAEEARPDAVEVLHCFGHSLTTWNGAPAHP